MVTAWSWFGTNMLGQGPALLRLYGICYVVVVSILAQPTLNHRIRLHPATTVAKFSSSNFKMNHPY